MGAGREALSKRGERKGTRHKEKEGYAEGEMRVK